MKKNMVFVAMATLGLVSVAAVACGGATTPDDGITTGAGGTGGTASSTGGASAGAATSTGGVVATGGAASTTGGAAGHAASAGTGTAGTSPTVGAGGASAGSAATGGATSTGGKTSAGGSGTAGTGTAGAGTAGTGAGGATVTCDSCLDTTCKTDLDACNGNMKCAAEWSCVASKCLVDNPPMGCVQSCLQGGGMNQTFTKLVQCSNQKCTGSCPHLGGNMGQGGMGQGGMGPGAGGGPGTGAGGGTTMCNFQQCYQQTCKMEAQACFQDKVCQPCFKNPGSAACSTDTAWAGVESCCQANTTGACVVCCK